MYEVQFHPSDIRKQVKYFFLTRKTARRLAAGAAAGLLLLLAGLAFAPLGVQSLLVSSELRILGHQNNLQREILEERRTGLERLRRRLEAASLRQQQMGLILGAPQNERGLGGFPEQLDLSVNVPEAQLAVRQAVKLDTDSKALLVLADDLARFAHENDELTRSVPSICPLPIGSFVLTSPFGERLSPFTNAPDFHAGIDLAAHVGTLTLAAGDGRVVFAGRFPLRRNVRWWRYGNVVVLSHAERYVSIYAHLDEIVVRRGQQVQRGESIGTVGNTGWSTSPHLHFEVRVRDGAEGEPVPVDPRIYILNYQWKGHEAMLAASRTAPAPAFDPLPSRFR
ncbi:MAG: M23 family metallopeptidase [bacterium]|nr:M23 family metallopeptidase [bacterium]